MSNISDEERERRSVRIHETKPWLKAKGAVTVEGKLISCQNAIKHGRRSQNPVIKMMVYAESWEQEKARIREIVLRQKDAYSKSNAKPNVFWQEAIDNLDELLAD